MIAAPPNPYASGPLNRAAHLRRDEGWLDTCLDAPGTRIVPVWRARNCVTDQAEPLALSFAADDARHLIRDAEFCAFLGLIGDTAYVAIDISPLEEPADALPKSAVFEDLRAVGPLLEPGSATILAYARGLFSWHRRHLFCGACGRPTKSAQSGHVRNCADAACGAQHFPRLDPAVIVLVHDGGERCVLGRQAQWPKGMHSTLAGFVEIGESLEDAVRREIAEESGLIVGDVRYHSSQPWPFPSSLMLGFYARADSTDIVRDDDELEDVGWFSRAQLLASPEDETFRLPRRDSIARRLIEDWLRG